jgi:hypothetical protein
LHVRLVTAELQQQWDSAQQLATMDALAGLAVRNVASLPADSAERLAAILQHGLSMLKTPDTSLDYKPDEAASTFSVQTLAYRTLVTALMALSVLHLVMICWAPSLRTQHCAKFDSACIGLA